MSKLLINEYPLQVLPSLAKAIGLNEAIILQQIHYWLRHAKVEHDGKMWIYKTIDKWHEQDFCFWSKDTIKRAIASLKKQELLLVEQLANNSFDRVNHYTIDYDVLAKIDINHHEKPVVVDKGILHQSDSANCTNHEGILHPSDEGILHPSLRDIKDINKESGHTQKINGDVLAVRESNTESISNWQPPSRETMQAQLFMAGKKLEMTDGQYQSHVEDFKAYYEEAAANGKPIKRENLRQSKLKNWLASISDRQPKQTADTAARPHSSRSDAFTTGDKPKLSRAQQIEKNRIAMQQAGL